MSETPANLMLISVGTGTEVYSYHDVDDDSHVMIQIHDDGTMEIHTIGQPIMPASTMQWLVSRSRDLGGSADAQAAG